MATDKFEHGGRLFMLQYTYAVPEEAWCAELSEAESAPAEWADSPDARTHLPGRALVIGVVPDEDPLRPVMVSFAPGTSELPYEVMQWFMTGLEAEIRRNRPDPVPGERTA